MRDCVTVIDIGSGSMKASIFKNVRGKLQSKAVVSRGFRLCSKIGGMIPGRKISAAIEFFEAVSALSRRHGVDDIVAISTQAAREAPNFRDLQNKIFRKFGIDVRVISGSEEAELTAFCVHKLAKLEKFISFDIGCGSVEVAKFDRFVHRTWSLPLSIIEFGAEQDFKKAETKIGNMLERLQFSPEDTAFPLVGNGGTLNVANAMISGGERTSLSRSEIMALFDRLKDKNIEDRIEAGVPRARADIFPFGLLAVLQIMGHACADMVFLTASNLRASLALDYFGILR
jgi:exopolyphosphatase/guanosine-5'-triphosphate,3'-diphosphate pyrophosphatase